MTNRALFPIGLVCVFALLGAMRTARHPFHITIAQAEVGIDEDGLQVLQVALRVDPGDLSKALTLRAERRIDIEKTEEIDTLILGYLDYVFRVRHPAKPEGDDPQPLAPCPAPSVDDANAPEQPPKQPATRPEEEIEKRKSFLRWVGKEVDIRYAWLYFEICIPDGLEGLEFSNQIFFELEPNQANTINFTDGQWKGSLSFTRQEAWATLKQEQNN